MAPLVSLAFKLLPLLSSVPEVIDALKSGNAEEAATKVVDIAKTVTGDNDSEVAVTRLLKDADKQLEYQKILSNERLEFARMASTERLAQMDITKVEVASDDKFKSRWRPAIGWTCVIILFFNFVPPAIVKTAVWGYSIYCLFTYPEMVVPTIPPFPDLNITEVLGILGTLLGAGWQAKLRTDEKREGIA